MTIRISIAHHCFVVANELIRDVFTNLISNAIKHSYPDRRLEIGIRTETSYRDGKDLFDMTVEDNGPGIPDDLKDRLFTPVPAGKDKGERTGLGLYLVKTLVEDMHGSVSVENRVKDDYRKGARFVVLLPVASDASRMDAGNC